MAAKNDLVKIALALTSCPTAPGHESQVRELVVKLLSGLPHVKTRQDEFGNLHAHYQNRPAARETFRLVAHLDHPGFVRAGCEIHFAGGVAEKYFVGKKVVFFTENEPRPMAKATIRAIDFTAEYKRVHFAQKIPSEAVFGMWDLPGPEIGKKLFLSRACDDLVQVASMVTLLRRLAQNNAPGNIHALFTRAEEIGFGGAFASLESSPKLAPMITLSLEASPARGFAKVGAGPIVRVGDRLSVFNSQVTHWLENAFLELKSLQPKTIYQRLLMGGGACEASVFHRAGLPTGALCVGLNHYHNMGPGWTLQRESISLADWLGQEEFLYFLATKASPLRQAEEKISQRFAGLRQKALRYLRLA